MPTNWGGSTQNRAAGASKIWAGLPKFRTAPEGCECKQANRSQFRARARERERGTATKGGGRQEGRRRNTQGKERRENHRLCQHCLFVAKARWRSSLGRCLRTRSDSQAAILRPRVHTACEPSLWPMWSVAGDRIIAIEGWFRRQMRSVESSPVGP